jgi:hypothetical protein
MKDDESMFREIILIINSLPCRPCRRCFEILSIIVASPEVHAPAGLSWEKKATVNFQSFLYNSFRLFSSSFCCAYLLEPDMRRRRTLLSLFSDTSSGYLKFMHLVLHVLQNTCFIRAINYAALLCERKDRNLAEKNCFSTPLLCPLSYVLFLFL